jgi:hypothetical protein
MAGLGVGRVPAVVGPGSLNMSKSCLRLTSPKVTSDAVLPCVELVS